MVEKNMVEKLINIIKNHKDNQYDYNEIYRSLRTNIEFSDFEKEMKVINITSTAPNEGKSSVASNLAIICSDRFEKVLLIDCDLRKPDQHNRFQVSNEIGLSNLMKEKELDINLNNDSYFKKVGKDTNNNHLYILTSGSKVSNSQELLSSNKFKELIQKLRNEFDFIVIDCPSVGAFTDAIPVSNVCDGTILVCSAKETNREDAKDSLIQLERNGAHVIGCVLTKVEDTTKYYGNYCNNDGE